MPNNSKPPPALVETRYLRQSQLIPAIVLLSDYANYERFRSFGRWGQAAREELRTLLDALERPTGHAGPQPNISVSQGRDAQRQSSEAGAERPVKSMEALSDG